MKYSDFLISRLKENGVTDAFGIPGGVLLDFLYNLESSEGINLHLNYHEQSSGFCACGFSQANHRLGFAYGTRGPGFTNLLTSIADAFCDSLPVLFITAHTGKNNNKSLRIDTEQELDCESICQTITKYSRKVDDIKSAVACLDEAIEIALSGRKGPVFLDINSSLFNEEVPVLSKAKSSFIRYTEFCDVSYDDYFYALSSSKRPVILIGDGIHQANVEKECLDFIDRSKIPVLSSRASQDLLPLSPLYFGYIGSHGLRYSNRIIFESDLIISLGNRIAFPLSSKSFTGALDNKKIIRVEIDKNEASRRIPNCVTMTIDLASFFKNAPSLVFEGNEWLERCECLKKHFYSSDVISVVTKISSLLSILPDDGLIVSDVGNNEFWLSRALSFSKTSNRVLYSKSFGALGCSLPKAIGAYYATKKPVFCFLGDQGFCMCLHELLYLSSHSIPIVLVLLNNEQSAMIKDREISKNYSFTFQVDRETDYFPPDAESICKSFNISYLNYDLINLDLVREHMANLNCPLLIEIKDNEKQTLIPFLKKGDECWDLSPKIPLKDFMCTDDEKQL